MKAVSIIKSLDSNYFIFSDKMHHRLVGLMNINLLLGVNWHYNTGFLFIEVLNS